MNTHEYVTLLYHAGCDRAHWTLGEVRKCAGRYVHGDAVKAVTFVDEKSTVLMEIACVRSGHHSSSDHIIGCPIRTADEEASQL